MHAKVRMWNSYYMYCSALVCVITTRGKIKGKNSSIPSYSNGELEFKIYLALKQKNTREIVNE